jgi:hypothetical protein
LDTAARETGQYMGAVLTIIAESHARDKRRTPHARTNPPSAKSAHVPGSGATTVNSRLLPETSRFSASTTAVAPAVGHLEITGVELAHHGAGSSRLSCHDFVDNEVRLLLFVLAYTLGNYFRQAVLPRSVSHWTLTTLREKLIKIGAKVVTHARRVIFQMAEVAVSRELFQSILKAIDRLRLPLSASG